MDITPPPPQQHQEGEPVLAMDDADGADAAYEADSAMEPVDASPPPLLQSDDLPSDGGTADQPTVAEVPSPPIPPPVKKDDEGEINSDVELEAAAVDDEEQQASLKRQRVESPTAAATSTSIESKKSALERLRSMKFGARDPFGETATRDLNPLQRFTRMDRSLPPGERRKRPKVDEESITPKAPSAHDEMENRRQRSTLFYLKGDQQQQKKGAGADQQPPQKKGQKFTPLHPLPPPPPPLPSTLAPKLPPLRQRIDQLLGMPDEQVLALPEQELKALLVQAVEMALEQDRVLELKKEQLFQLDQIIAKEKEHVEQLSREIPAHMRQGFPPTAGGGGGGDSTGPPLPPMPSLMPPTVLLGDIQSRLGLPAGASFLPLPPIPFAISGSAAGVDTSKAPPPNIFSSPPPSVITQAPTMTNTSVPPPSVPTTSSVPSVFSQPPPSITSEPNKDQQPGGSVAQQFNVPPPLPAKFTVPPPAVPSQVVAVEAPSTTAAPSSSLTAALDLSQPPPNLKAATHQMHTSLPPPPLPNLTQPPPNIVLTQHPHHQMRMGSAAAHQDAANAPPMAIHLTTAPLSLLGLGGQASNMLGTANRAPATPPRPTPRPLMSIDQPPPPGFPTLRNIVSQQQQQQMGVPGQGISSGSSKSSNSNQSPVKRRQQQQGKGGGRNRSLSNRKRVGAQKREVTGEEVKAQPPRASSLPRQLGEGGGGGGEGGGAQEETSTELEPEQSGEEVDTRPAEADTISAPEEHTISASEEQQPLANEEGGEAISEDS